MAPAHPDVVDWSASRGRRRVIAVRLIQRGRSRPTSLTDLRRRLRPRSAQTRQSSPRRSCTRGNCITEAVVVSAGHRRLNVERERCIPRARPQPAAGRDHWTPQPDQRLAISVACRTWSHSPNAGTDIKLQLPGAIRSSTAPRCRGSLRVIPGRRVRTRSRSLAARSAAA